MRTLVLDGAYQPHRIVTWERAAEMVWSGKAEILSVYDDAVRAVSAAAAGFSRQMKQWMDLCAESPSSEIVVIKVPAVVRLLTTLGRKRVVTFSRINVMTRDGFKCCYCGARKPMSQLNYDHVTPRSHGGKTSWENVVTSCIPCNARKADRTPEQAGMALLRPPVVPKSLPIVTFRPGPSDTFPSLWRDYLYWNVELESG